MAQLPQMRKAKMTKNTKYQDGKRLSVGDEVMIQETFLGRGRRAYTASMPDRDGKGIISIPVTPSMFEYTEKTKFVVMVTRVSYCTKTFEVEAKTKEEAENLADEEACNTVFGEDTAEYKIEGSYTKDVWDNLGK